MPSGELEAPRVHSVEVVVLWGADVLHVSHLTPPRSFYLGEELPHRGARGFLLPAEKLATSCWPVVIADGASIVLVVPPRARGHVQLPAEPPVSLERARPRGQPSPEVAGGFRFDLPQYARARVEIEQFVCLIAVIDAEPLPRVARSNWEWTPVGYFLLSLLLHFVLIAALTWLAPPHDLACDLDTRRDRTKLMQYYLHAASAREQPPTDASSRASRQPPHRGGPYRQQPIEPSCLGDLSPSAVLDPASGSGASRGLEDGAVQPLVWGDDFPDVLVAVGRSLVGSSAGSLRLPGIGEGVTCRGGSVVLGSLGNRTRYDAEQQLRPRPVRRIPTQVRILPLEVDGLLSPELIRHAIWRSLNQFSLCYEKGLARKPDLSGRITLRFVIGRNGSVLRLSNGGSDLPDLDVVRCVVSTYYRVGFPEPERGTATVLSHLLFAPGWSRLLPWEAHDGGPEPFCY